MPPFILLLALSLAVASSTPSTKKRSAKNASIKAKAATAPSQKTPAQGETEVKAKTAIVSLSDVPVVNEPASILKIRSAVGTMLMQSETDAIIEVRYWLSDADAISSDKVALLVDAKKEAKTEIKTVREFFRNSTLIENWMNDEEKATATGFQKLVETLEIELENPQVYLFGERERTVVIIGKVKGGFGGLVTLVVET